MRYLIIGILLCAYLAVVVVEIKQIHLGMTSLENLSFRLMQYKTDLSLYIFLFCAFNQFKRKMDFSLLLFCWVSMDFASYATDVKGHVEHAYFAIINLITLSYFAIQYKRNVNIVISFGIMVLFQLFMILDWFNGDSQTVLYVNYHYILTGIHLLIISTMVKWTIINRCRAYLDYYCRRFFLVFG